MTAQRRRSSAAQPKPKSRQRKRAPRLDRADARLEQLYEISKLLVSFAGPQETVPSALAIAARVLPIRSAVLLEETGGRLRMVTWSAPGHAGLEQAVAHAEQSYAYLAGPLPPESLERSDVGLEALAAPGPAAEGSFVDIPLVVGRRVFGVLQVEGPAGLGREDVAFVSAIAHQLAVTLDRYNAWQRDIAQKEQAEEATRLRERILGVVSHDLRNPLATILMTTGALAKVGKPGGVFVDREKALVRIQSATQRMLRLIEDLLDFVSVQSGQLSIAPRACAPALVITETVALFEEPARAKGLKLVTELDPQLPKVLGDPDRLLQVLSNLVANALTATRAGGSITIRASATERAVVFSVRDTGAGIPEDLLEGLFDGQKGPKRLGPGGKGLGLSIASGIVAAHGGRIWVESQLGQGSTFFFTVPSLDKERKLRLLVADDDPEVLDQVASSFERPGTEVLRAATGGDVLDRLANHGPFDLIITDVSMPWMTGLQVAHSARTAGLGTPIIVITALADPTLERQVADLGTNARLLRKPFTLDDLESTAQALLPELKGL